MLFFFRQRANQPTYGGNCTGWDLHLEGSVAGEFLMGASGYLRFQSNPALQQQVEQLVEVSWRRHHAATVIAQAASLQGIANCTDASTGYMMAFPENLLSNSEHPDYVQSWVTHGLMEAHRTGNPLALPLLRAHFSVYPPRGPSLLRDFAIRRLFQQPHATAQLSSTRWGMGRRATVSRWSGTTSLF
jgi:hypothetical protein